MTVATKPPKDWKSLPDGSFTRDLVGGEILMAWMHDQRQGGGRYNGGIEIQTSFTIPEAERRLKTAWLRTRARHPLLGISFKLNGRGGKMMYPVFPDEEYALNWRRNTIIFLREEDFGTLDETMSSIDSHNTHPADGHAKLYVLARSNGSISLLINASHALLDVFSCGVVWQTLIDEVALALDKESATIEWGQEVENLPRPIANVLGEAYPQSWFEWLKSMWNTLRALKNVTAESIRPPLHPQLTQRLVSANSHTHVYSAEETTRFVARCKEAKTTVTYAYIAILALAMQDLYAPDDASSSKKKEQAQVFAMPYNGRRWLAAGLSPAPPHSPSLGNTTAYIRIPHSGPPLRASSSTTSSSSSTRTSPSSSNSDITDDTKARLLLRDARVKRILEFGERYKEQSLKIINSPTPNGVLASKTLAPLLVRALEKSDPEKPAGTLFVVVSQGQVDKLFPHKANVEGSDILVTDYRNGGRSVDNNPLMMLYTWRDQMHVKFKWNSKYFDQKTFEDINAKMVEYFNDFMEAGSVPSP